MSAARRATTLVGATAILLGAAGTAHAAAEVELGGYHEQVLRQAQRDLMGPSLDADDAVRVGGIRISVEAGEASAVTNFTPRFAGLGLGFAERVPPATGAGLKESYEPGARPTDRREVRIGPDQRAEIAGLEVGWAAIAEVGAPVARTDDASAFMLGGELAVSGLRLDATIGQEPGLMGVDGQRVSAGLGYDFGAFDTRLGYSLVERGTTEETSFVTLGSQLTLRPWLVLQGDLAYAEEQQGETATAGRVTLRLNF